MYFIGILCDKSTQNVHLWSGRKILRNYLFHKNLKRGEYISTQPSWISVLFEVTSIWENDFVSFAHLQIFAQSF